MKKQATNLYSIPSAANIFEVGFNAGVNHSERFTYTDERYLEKGCEVGMPDMNEPILFGYENTNPNETFAYVGYFDGFWRSNGETVFKAIQFWRYISCNRKLANKKADWDKLDAFSKECNTNTQEDDE